MKITIEQINSIKKNINVVENYPKKGIFFYDITGILENPKAYAEVITLMVKSYTKTTFTKVVGIEARGFLFGAPVALKLGLGFVPLRKQGKLPRKTYSEKYTLEYGTSVLEVHKHSITPQDKVLIVDDLLATGGTTEAAVKLVRKAGGQVSNAAFLIDLKIGGEVKLRSQGITCTSLLNVNEKNKSQI